VIARNELILNRSFLYCEPKVQSFENKNAFSSPDGSDILLTLPKRKKIKRTAGPNEIKKQKALLLKKLRCFSNFEIATFSNLTIFALLKSEYNGIIRTRNFT